MYIGTYSKVGTTNTAACSQAHLTGRLYFIPSLVTAWVKGRKGVVLSDFFPKQSFRVLSLGHAVRMRSTPR